MRLDRFGKLLVVARAGLGYGQRWTIWFQMIPVIPALVKDPLFK